MTTLPAIQPKTTMEEAWDEYERQRSQGSRYGAGRDRLLAEAARLGVERDRRLADAELAVVITAHALYGQDVEIDWWNHTVTLAVDKKERG